ncbi:topoisomerase, partial [Aeromonas salmonicida subsp. achromogenes]
MECQSGSWSTEWHKLLGERLPG